MSSSLYLLMIISCILVFVVIIFVVVAHKRTRHTQLYSEGMRHENAGDYDLAIHDYEDALNEIVKHKQDKEFANKIVQKIKILRTTIDYEKNFHTDQEHDTA